MIPRLHVKGEREVWFLPGGLSLFYVSCNKAILMCPFIIRNEILFLCHFKCSYTSDMALSRAPLKQRHFNLACRSSCTLTIWSVNVRQRWRLHTRDGCGAQQKDGSDCRRLLLSDPLAYAGHGHALASLPPMAYDHGLGYALSSCTLTRWSAKQDSATFQLIFGTFYLLLGCLQPHSC